MNAPTIASAGAQYPAIARTARKFEAQALSALLKPVFGEAPKGLLSAGPAEEQWRPMLVENYARAWSDKGGVGIGDAVFREMLRMQSAGQPSSSQEGAL